MLDMNFLSDGVQWQESFRDVRSDPCFTQCDGYLYIFSGGGDNSVERFSVMIGVWGQSDSISQVRHGATCVTAGQDTYIIGGVDQHNTVLSSVELYHNTMFVNETAAVTTETASDDDNNNQSSVAALNVARAGAEAVLK